MICDFCGCELPVLSTSSERCIYESYYTESVPLLDGYKNLCKTCAARLDAFGAALLQKDCRRRVQNFKNASANALNKLRGKELHPYMVAIDIGMKDQPVAQVCRKDGDRWVLTNMIRGEAVGHLITYMEGSGYGK